MVMDDIGTKNLIAGILDRGKKDFLNFDGCPNTCPLIDGCESKKSNEKHCEARQFLESSWAEDLMDALGDTPESFMRKVQAQYRLPKETYKYIESEIKEYKETLKRLAGLKKDIILEAPIRQEGKSYAISDTTYAKAAKILTERRIQRLEDVADAITRVYEACDEQKRQMIALEFWENKHQAVISYILNVNIKTINRWKTAVIYAVAREMGYLPE
jgi:RinA family phage transcriptional activator